MDFQIEILKSTADCRLSGPLVLGIVHLSKASALPTSCTYKRRENGELMKTPLMRVPTYHQKFNHNTRKKKNERGLALHRCLRNSVPQTCVVRPKPGLASYVEEITVYSGI